MIDPISLRIGVFDRPLSVLGRGVFLPPDQQKPPTSGMSLKKLDLSVFTLCVLVVCLMFVCYVYIYIYIHIYVAGRFPCFQWQASKG